MNVLPANVTVGHSLSISVSGTDYLQRSLAAGVMPGTLPETQLQKDVVSGKVSAKQAMGQVSEATIKAIENALERGEAGTSILSLASGASNSSGAGIFFSLIA